MAGRRAKSRLLIVLAAAGAVGVSLGTLALAAEMMKQPEMVTLSGRLFDLTCGAKGHAMMGEWVNARNQDHMMPDGTKKDCATMCLKGGQPAALFDTKDSKIVAVFACNPRATLSDYAAQDVEVQGFWAARSKDGLSTFVPQKIRAAGKSAGWADVDCATMHG